MWRARRWASSGAASVVIRPIGTAVPTSDASITLAPTPAIALTDAGRKEIALRLLVTPGLEALVQLLSEELDTALGTPPAGGTAPTIRTLLTGAGLLDGGHVRVPLPDPLTMLVGAAGVIASEVSVAIAEGLDLHVVADGSRLGLALRGSGGLVLVVLKKPAAGGWGIAPGISLENVGAGLSREGGLVQTTVLTLDGVAAAIGVSVDLDIATGHLTVSPITGSVTVKGLGLPALSGGSGGNPVAGSLVGDSQKKGAPVNPPLTVTVSWDGNALGVQIAGAAPGQPFWITVGKTFGPLHIDRIGLLSGTGTFRVDGNSVQTAYVGVAVDGGIVAGPLSIAVQGLAIKIPPKYAHRPETWQLDLDGLSVDYNGPSVQIAGGLLKAQVTDGNGVPLVYNGQPVYDYRGMLQIQAFGYGAAALGAYSQVPRPNGTTFASLFIFAAINGPIGGPPYLFITGLAGGFGFNRDLLPPAAPEAIGAFPLIAVMGPLTAPAGEVMKNMGPSLPPRDGALWLAAGITFSTFELLKTRALAYFKINPQGFEIGVLGLMGAALPTRDNTLATIELGLRASYSSVDQVLSVRAGLTANSWLFTKDCRLTGGFAFVVWFTRPQVVLTVGGYGPLFERPDYFPDVPPLGFAWRFSDTIVIKGEQYFAVTPQAAMAGGRLEVTASGDWGYASMVMYLDAIFWFHPPRFLLELGFRITGKAFGFGFDVSAEVHLELPPAYGRVRVHFMWGFEFEFGGAKLPPQFLPFGDFFTKFVGALDSALYSVRVLTGSGSIPNEETADGSAAKPFRVLPEFRLEVNSKLPGRTVALAGTSFTSTAPTPLYAVPMGPRVALDPTLSVAVTRQRADGAFEPVDAGRLGALAPSVVDAGVAAAVWAGAAQTGTLTPAVPTGDDMRRMPTGLALGAAASIASTAGLGALAVGIMVDDNAAQPLPLDVPGVPVLPPPPGPVPPAVPPIPGHPGHPGLPPIPALPGVPPVAVRLSGPAARAAAARAAARAAEARVAEARAVPAGTAVPGPVAAPVAGP